MTVVISEITFLVVIISVFTTCSCFPAHNKLPENGSETLESVDETEENKSAPESRASPESDILPKRLPESEISPERAPKINTSPERAPHRENDYLVDSGPLEAPTAPDYDSQYSREAPKTFNRFGIRAPYRPGRPVRRSRPYRWGTCYSGYGRPYRCRKCQDPNDYNGYSIECNSILDY